MSNQLIPVFQQYSNNNGATESGLVLHTYEAGTLVNKATYQTYGGTANTNPVVMDSAGYPPAGIYGSGSYRLILKDSEGVTLKDLDNVVLTEGLQPDVDGNYLISGDLEVEGSLTIGDAVIEANGDYVVTLDGAEVQRITPEGNIGYSAASIPDTLDPTAFYQFSSDGAEWTRQNQRFVGDGVYFDGTNYIALKTGDLTLTLLEDGQFKLRAYLGATVGDNLGSSINGAGWSTITPS